MAQLFKDQDGIYYALGDIDELIDRSQIPNIVPNAEIDELMVPAICMLNTKGYITKSCCSGHVLSSLIISEYAIYAGDEIPEDTLYLEYDEENSSSDYGDVWHSVHRVEGDQEAYIQFQDMHTFSIPLPEGWSLDDDKTVIRSRFAEDFPQKEFYLRRLESILLLCDWIEQLPCINTEHIPENN